jgi:hypothetical protein
MIIAEGIEMLEIPALLMTGLGVVNPVVFWDHHVAVLSMRRDGNESK